MSELVNELHKPPNKIALSRLHSHTHSTGLNGNALFLYLAQGQRRRRQQQQQEGGEGRGGWGKGGSIIYALAFCAFNGKWEICWRSTCLKIEKELATQLPTVHVVRGQATFQADRKP